VLLYIVVPVIAAQILRRPCWRGAGRRRWTGCCARWAGVAGGAAGHAGAVVRVPGSGDRGAALVIALLAVPILIQVYGNAALAYWLSRRWAWPGCVAAPAALIGASNFFELAVAAAVSLFGLQSGAALATVVGVLVEVPVMLSIVGLVKATRGWYERTPA
jgi:ACR3 family arsenite transporter